MELFRSATSFKRINGAGLLLAHGDLRTIWRRGRSGPVAGYRPHFTSAIYDSPEITEQTAWEAMLRAVTYETQLRIAFKRIRWFVDPPLVLWAEPTTAQVLARWHTSISETIDPAYCRHHYRPGAWTPHCTLGTRIADAKSDDAMAFARSFDRNITVLFDVVDCVTFPPARVVAEQRLPPVPKLR
jgi:2'-5' RNA ligase superfamily protein